MNLSWGTDPDVVRSLKAHWATAGLSRIADPKADDIFSYNVCSLSHGDLDRIRGLLRATYREIRSIVAASAPEETVALVNLQLMEWSSD